MKLILILTLIMSTLWAKSYPLTNDQKQKITIAYDIGKNITANDGMTFEYALPSIMGQESSFGVFVVGDKWGNGRLKSLYDSSLGNFQIKLSTAKLVIKKNPKLLKRYSYLVYEGKSIYHDFEKHKKQISIYETLTNKGINYFIRLKTTENKHLKKIEYYNHVLHSTTWINRFNNKNHKKHKLAVRTFKWANKELKYHQIKYDRDLKLITSNANREYTNNIKKLNNHIESYNLLLSKAQKDTRLINKLLTDYRFGAIIAGNYIKMLYNEAVSRGLSNAYRRSIGRYNGGWNNLVYFNLVKKRMKVVKSFISNK